MTSSRSTFSRSARLSRRSFLQVTSGAACACALSGCGDNPPPVLRQDVTLTIADYPALAAPGGEVELGANVTSYNYPIFVRNEGDGVYRALSGWCDHEGCAVVRSGSGFVCPCHDARFALDGELQRGPATRSLITFDTTSDGTTLTILANA